MRERERERERERDNSKTEIDTDNECGRGERTSILFTRYCVDERTSLIYEIYLHRLKHVFQNSPILEIWTIIAQLIETLC